MALKRWWPVDTVFAVYLLAVSALIAVFHQRIPDAGWLLAAHAAGLGLLGVAHRSQTLHSWYPLAYIPLCYKEMAVLIPSVRGTDLDAAMAAADYRLWHANPTVWLERVYSPWLTEYLQIIYTLFIPCIIVVAAWLWFSLPHSHFRYYAFLVTLGFLTSYVGYFLAPVRGPRFFLEHLQHTRLEGVWVFERLREGLDKLESAHWDCFPSGHTELTLIVCWTSRLISNKLFGIFCVYTASIVFATVYLRYHYTVDVVAGAALAILVILAAPRLYAAAGGGRQGELVD